MGRKQRERLVVFNRINQGELRRRAAREVPGLSLRRVPRMDPRWVREGDAGMRHRGRGKALHGLPLHDDEPSSA